MGFKSRADHISYPLPTTRHCCNLDVWALAASAKPQSWAPLTRDTQKGAKRV